ncbi:hypothetical protein AMTRI_Chr03g53700 [Amborella trichopoda]|uniref:Glycosyltransferase n=1 Tax=Amborella trichopoda TaxID=13333 RepID=W1P188_AMBTC|nr:UDP-glycosyltransferase 87A2 [Amborella trichopoda]ERN01326.1 hypothetical protein AMTR_s00002p00256140 [Amborella trichopoda]|eukprot:XP_006838757.1 UDP-glycosyltransferase 87A2 [Amborella trichopoda]
MAEQKIPVVQEPDPGHAEPMIVAIPYPGQGHINPMMRLCMRLASKGALIRIVVTEEWLSFMTSAQEPPPNVRLLSIPNVIPSELSRAADWVGFVQAVNSTMEEPVDRLIDSIEPMVSVIVADVYMPWVADMAKRRGIPVTWLFPMAATVFSVFYHCEVLLSKGHFPANSSANKEEYVDYIPGVSPTRILELPNLFKGGESREIAESLKFFHQIQNAKSILFNSFYELEPSAIDALSSLVPRPIFPVGPLIPFPAPKDHELKTNARPELDCSSWLDSQPHGSTLYVSLGSVMLVPAKQMEELAHGLIESVTRFIWVAREPSINLRDMCTDRGLVVPWCSQSKVLRHPSVGGFLTHCGWNSTVEGVLTGVPMLTFPIYFDQQTNSKLIVDDWKVGLRVRSGPMDEMEVVDRREIANVVRRLMEGEESKEMRRRIEELREAGEKALEKGGSSDANMNDFLKSLRS